MLNGLSLFFKKVLHRKYDPRRHKKTEFTTAAVSYPYCLTAILFLGFQVLVATAGFG